MPIRQGRSEGLLTFVGRLIYGGGGYGAFIGFGGGRKNRNKNRK